MRMELLKLIKNNRKLAKSYDNLKLAENNGRFFHSNFVEFIFHLSCCDEINENELKEIITNVIKLKKALTTKTK